MKKDGELLMTCKAYNGRVVTEWLSDALRRCHADASDPRMSCAYVCVILGAVHHSIRLVCVCVFACVCVCACKCGSIPRGFGYISLPIKMPSAQNMHAAYFLHVRLV